MYKYFMPCENQCTFLSWQICNIQPPDGLLGTDWTGNSQDDSCHQLQSLQGAWKHSGTSCNRRVLPVLDASCFGPQAKGPWSSVSSTSDHCKPHHNNLGQLPVLCPGVSVHLDAKRESTSPSARRIPSISRHTGYPGLYRDPLPNTFLFATTKWGLFKLQVSLHLQSFSRNGTSWCNNICFCTVCRVY